MKNAQKLDELSTWYFLDNVQVLWVLEIMNATLSTFLFPLLPAHSEGYSAKTKLICG